LPGVEFIAADLTKKETLYPLFDHDFEFDAIFHPASLYDYFAELDLLRKINVRGIENLLEVMVDHYHAVSPDALLALIGYLSFYIQMNQIEYVEWQVAVSDLIAQRILKDWGFHIFGYLLAWEPKPTLDTFEDVVVFGWSKILPEISQIQLLPDGLALAMKIMQNL
jgi:hypothetical protein